MNECPGGSVNAAAHKFFNKQSIFTCIQLGPGIIVLGKVGEAGSRRCAWLRAGTARDANRIGLTSSNPADVQTGLAL